MNKKVLLKALTEYQKWFAANKKQALLEYREREELALQARRFTREVLLNMSEEQLYDYIAPLWAMAMWGNKHYQIDNIIEANGMDLLRKQFANLIYGTSPIEKRWDEFRSKVKGIGPAIMSELLCKTYPDSFLLWNKKTYNGFSALEIANLPRFEARLNGYKYSKLCEIGKQIIHEIKTSGNGEVTDMLTLNSFIWKELQEVTKEPVATSKQEGGELLPTSTKEATFIHNDIRDKVAEIGRCLGFRAEVEKKVADGAVVDAVWEVTIGNMGRVIYVFEVQTAGSIDSLILNLMKSKNNKAVQGIVAVTDQKQIERIKREIAALPIKDEVHFWDYEEVLRIHESLQFVNESINNLDLVPKGL
ncbi:hypothetical protein [Tannerella forsythia]|uniref:Uncharacterized protein n=1 Tax=Tannerella forsythia TaxID=28112 RepID=A0A3P1XPD0_TANFO|nr:hypothetical protein [Tannerella forsythia]RRD59926.1 hypothetical protein EII40_08450 [Tannerella forsythia]